MATASAGRKGRRYRAARQQMFAQHGDVCSICGHHGAGDAHHVPARKRLIELGLDPDDPRYLRPAHGVESPCPVCPWVKGKPRRCNQIVGAKTPTRRARPLSRW